MMSLKISLIKLMLWKIFTVNQLIRLKEKKCSTENSIIYTKILTDFERIGDHGLNIAESLYHIRKIMKQMKMIKPEIEE